MPNGRARRQVDLRKPLGRNCKIQVLAVADLAKCGDRKDWEGR